VDKWATGREGGKEKIQTAIRDCWLWTVDWRRQKYWYFNNY